VRRRLSRPADVDDAAMLRIGEQRYGRAVRIRHRAVRAVQASRSRQCARQYRI